MNKRRARVVCLWFDPITKKETLRKTAAFTFSAMFGLGIELMAAIKTFPVFPDRVEMDFE